MTDHEKNHRISLNLLSSYLLILLAPVIAIGAIYFTARDAMIETQKERIQNSVSEIGTEFDREVEQAQKVGYYVCREGRLCNYLLQGTPSGKEQEFYSLYTIANNYPNYTLTNQIIKNVFVFIADSEYAIKIPQVIPLTGGRGGIMFDEFPFGSYDDFMEFYEKQDRSQTLFYYEDENKEGTLFVFSQATYPYLVPGKSAVVVQLNWSRLRQMLQSVLAGKDGIAALVDENGRILACAEHGAGQEGLSAQNRTTMDEYLKNSLWGKNSLVTLSQNSRYNGWHVVFATPKSVLTEGIGVARYASVALCAVAVFIGLIVCLVYWYQRKSMVQEYFKLQERMGTRTNGKKESMWFWRGFDEFLVDVDRLQSTVEKQENALREDFLRKLLYGNFDSEEETRDAAQKAGISMENHYYYVVDMEFEDPLRSGLTVTREEFSTAMSELFSQYLTWSYWRYQISELSIVLLIQSDEEVPAKEIKEALEKMNYEFYTIFQVQSYTGISWMVTESIEVARQYEIASRISEFARYRGIRVPVLPTELPKEQIQDQPLFFTIDMELKLVNQIQSGSAEQLEEMIAQIRNVYFRPGNSQYTYRHTIEVLRGCLFRSIPMEDEKPEAKRLRDEAQKVCCAESIFDLLRRTRQFCAELHEEKEEVVPDLDREKITNYIEENFGNACLNLSMLAEWLEEPERKLYNDFKLCFGMSFSSYVEQRRMAHACDLLKKGVAVKDTAEKVGYGSDYSFRRAFKRVVGIPPSDFRKMQTV